MSEAHKTVDEIVREEELSKLWWKLKGIDRRHYELSTQIDDYGVLQLSNQQKEEWDHLDMSQYEIEREIINRMYYELDRRFGRKG